MVTVKTIHTVQPAEPTPNEIMYLSDLDQIKAVTHAPTVHFYGPNTDFLYSDAIQILKDSLSKALVIFYPLAGRLHEIEFGGGRLELHCDAKGAILVEAETESTVEDFAKQDFLPNEKMRELIPKMDYSNTPISEQPLVLAQLTKFSCGGLSLGLGISHVLVDGPSAFHFINEWAKISRGEKTGILPVLDRKILQIEEPPKFEHTVLTPPPLLIGQSDNTEERKKPTAIAMLKLSKGQIDKLKDKANEGKLYNNSSRPYSRYEAVAGHVWRCASKARRLVDEQLTRLHVAVSFRNRIQPPIPQGFFGNANLREAAITTVGELLSNPLSYASSKIRETVDQVTDEYVRSYLGLIKALPDVSVHRNFHTAGCAMGAFYGNPNMEVTSWTSMPVYDANFGWGEVIHLGPGSMGFDGKSFIILDRDGGGSFTLALCLQQEYIDTFKKLFYEEISAISLCSPQAQNKPSLPA
ncbi:spermidine hydroxycinnamoyl transferase-like [Olea europaea subsp. europaea]|uniref:Spermidine hydroxycinnamoyl transferase-like n=1 Tax=Olea europaea subsp. europaea TaxID=158383 RepID=A0A8S0V830_OLEEU|nr:spermidine hydroxycinnamoyl transferase-like [Olea europaea subsp. europaea]